LLAQHIERSTPPLPNLKAITVTAEPISVDQKRMVERVFGCPVYVLYGTREFGIIAGEAPGLTGMHINPLSNLVEFIQPDGKPAESGKPGQIVVTDLLNRGQPMIRYRIGDIGIPIEPFGPGGCGLPRLEMQASRETDLVITPEGKYVCGASLTLISAKGVSKLQFIQTQLDRLTVRFVRNEAYSPETQPELRLQLSRALGPNVNLEFCEMEEIPVLASGKYQYVHSEVAKKHFCTPSA
jgi:phenylacetate-CoA ligase